MRDNLRSQSPFWPPEFDFHLPFETGNAFENLGRSARRNPDRPAIYYYGTTITYAELLARVLSLAGHLQHRCAVKRGDRVLLDMQNSPQFVTAFYAILRADAVVVPVNPMNVTGELEYLATDSGARVALIGDELIDRFSPLVGTLLDHVLVARYADDVPEDCPDHLPEVMRRAPTPPVREPFYGILPRRYEQVATRAKCC